ncbi:hypothetical protein EYF80_035997 [Liparis tanakae]|uniref:Uncharacterized protein n=1 Tax=Liparis tanakae TaxID=230148 RepID=A0A4Z2GLW2_9TELE|nr:hypothetical protein EYF80_035997 [Liparis tanakae]
MPPARRIDGVLSLIKAKSPVSVSAVLHIAALSRLFNFNTTLEAVDLSSRRNDTGSFFQWKYVG